MKEVKFEKDEVEFLLDFCKNDNSKISDKILRKLERAKTPIKTSSRKGKGRNLQHKVCQMIADNFNVEFNQNDPDCLIHSREMGQHGTDIILRGELRKKFPYSIECKAQENLNIGDWIKQAKANEEKNMNWLLVFKKQSIGVEPIVCLDFKTFLDILNCGDK